jgi:predicted MFS family arabinose efflux permease
VSGAARAGERAVPLLALASFATATQSFVHAGLLAEIAADLGTTVAAAGQIGTVYALAFALAAPPIALATASIERRRLIIGALLLLGLLNLVTAVVPDLASLLGLRVLIGIASAAVIPAATATAATLAPPERRGRALGLVIAGTTAAFLIGIPLGSVIGEASGWRAIFVFAAVIALLAALAVRLGLPTVAAVTAPTGGLPALRRPGVPATLGLTVLGFAAVFCFAAFVGPGVNRVTGLAGAWVGVMQAMVGVGALVGVPAGAWLADRAGMASARWPIAAIIAGQALTAALLAGAADGSGLGVPALALAILMVAGGLFALTPILQAHLVALAPDARGLLLAFNASGSFVGQAGGAALGGLAIALAGLPAMSVAGMLAGLLALVVLARRQR